MDKVEINNAKVEINASPLWEDKPGRGLDWEDKPGRGLDWEILGHARRRLQDYYIGGN